MSGGRLDTLLRIASDQRASDLHLHAGKVPHVRHDGRLVPLPFRELGAHQLRTMLDEILNAEQRAELSTARHLDFAYAVDDVGRFRGSITAQTDGYSAVFRVIPTSIGTLTELDVPAVVGSFARHANGLVLVTGPPARARPPRSRPSSTSSTRARADT